MLIEEFEDFTDNSGFGQCIPAQPDRLISGILSPRPKLKEAHEYHSVIDLIFRLIVAEIAYSLQNKDCPEHFSVDALVQYFHWVSMLTQLLQAIALLKRTKLLHYHTSLLMSYSHDAAVLWSAE